MIGTIISHYKILRKLGAGGMGEVYLADDMKLHRQVALKFLAPQYTLSLGFKARFEEREARAAAALKHPNIITIYDLGEYQDKSYIVMEYVEGGSLADWIAGRKLSAGEAIELSMQICAGLSAAHREGIVHRDVKPANILIDRNRIIKIVDFGLAKLQGVTKLTRDGARMGTPHYMSPEQVRGEDLDHRSDIFSFGVVLYEMLTGRLPFHGENQLAVLYAITNDTPRALASHKPELWQGLQKIVDRALDKNLSTRYQNIEECQRDLRKAYKIVSSSTQTAPPKPKPQPRPVGMKIAFFTAIAVLLTLLVVLLLREWHAEERNLLRKLCSPSTQRRQGPWSF